MFWPRVETRAAWKSRRTEGQVLRYVVWKEPAPSDSTNPESQRHHPPADGLPAAAGSRRPPGCGKLTRVDKHAELRLRILQGESDANIDFDDLRRLLGWLGFEERIRGSHHIFRKQGVRELINLQKEGNKAKVYQVRQARRIILRYGLMGGER